MRYAYNIALKNKGFKVLWINKLCKRNIHIFYQVVFLIKNVDIVDNLLTEEIFPDFYNVSGAHSYQQVSVDTMFK